MLLGLPCVGLEGVEPSSKTEAYILDILGLKNEFSATSPDDYTQKFLGLARRILDGDAPEIDRGDVYRKLYGEQISTDFGKVIKWVYDNKLSMKISGRRDFKVYEEL